MEFIERDKYKYKSGIYGIRNKINNKIYVGQTSMRFLKRYHHHVWKLKNNSHDNKHLQNAWNKYGEENFEYIILEVVENPKENFYKLDEIEKDFIKKFRKENLSYNIQCGGQLSHDGPNLSEEQRKKIGKINKERMTGSKLSEETRLKMSETRRGKHINRKTDVINLDIAYKIKEMFVDGKDASSIAKELNVPYKIVNGIMSNNTWAMVKVDGWDEYRNNRKISHRMSKQDQRNIYELYKDNCPKIEIAKKYNKTVGCINKIIRKFEKVC